MTLAVVEEEVRRFLSDPIPEVLCIKGKWGVGKTFGWRTFLRKARDDNNLAMRRYAYVSLFGLNSLDDLRYALFERTVTGDAIGEDPSPETFREMVGDRNAGRKLKPIIDGALAFFNRQGVSDLLAKAAILTVRNQLICFDDLERAGDGLGTREVLGLASLLKEERHCKVVLLLNDQEHDDQDEFARQLEKVADVTLKFEPTTSEACDIALDHDASFADLIRSRIEQLDITNIRVIRKIERLAKRLARILDNYDPIIADEALATLVLASWSVQQPKLAPPIDVMRRYNALSMSAHFGDKPVDPEFKRFQEIVADYPFRYANDLDRAVIDGAEAGYFVEADIRETAQQLEAELKANSRNNALSRAWHELYHGSLATDDDVFLDAVYEGALKDAAFTNAVNINSAIYILRECGREDQAAEVTKAYIEANASQRPEFFDVGSHFSGGDRVEDTLRAAFAEARANYVDDRDPLDVLREIGVRRAYDERDVMLMARQGPDNFELMFEALQGEEVRHSIEIIRQLARSHRPEAAAIDQASREALKRISEKSPLRARKIGRFIDLDGEGPDETN
ncbi:hypothetical protein B2G71_22885 [Novosphingobium sp. PC22D]|uniref:hypothetical protein n=1 Tax=Novosphingobium sp. PC22D TaxID=1962403 RepID=UPI000BF1A84B|nr:hypothetical protein [Novosphingobium sp. PC22D]PEQ10352.1 hypothetical protein B2G71_22885 [Novosphingobium sp. PC22D]